MTCQGVRRPERFYQLTLMGLFEERGRADIFGHCER
jgi:hypothetical protein